MVFIPRLAVLARDTALLLPLVLVSELPTRVFLYVRTRDTLNQVQVKVQVQVIFLESGTPLKSGPTSNRKLVTICLT